MRLDRYIGEEPKFKVLRRQPDGSYQEVPAFDYFVLALKDANTSTALDAYATAASVNRDDELAADVWRLADEARMRDDRKLPD
jgi:hypothetical protein